MDIRDELITGSYIVGDDGRKEPINWKVYAIQVEEKVKQLQLIISGKTFFDEKEALEAKIAELEGDIENYLSVMVAAAEEIQEHWEAHCDEDGYGPSNLMHRLEKGIAANYPGYKPGEFENLYKQINRLKNDLLDALDLKEGKGPTALSMLSAERDRLKSELDKANGQVRQAKALLRQLQLISNPTLRAPLYLDLKQDLIDFLKDKK